MSLKSLFAPSAVVVALAALAAACSSAMPDGQSSESSSEAIRFCPPPPLPACPPTPVGEPELPACRLCPVGEEWSTSLCRCAPIDAGADAASDAPDGGTTTATDGGCFENVMCTASHVWSPTACACVCPTPEPTNGCGPFRVWSDTACACVPDLCRGVACPLEGAAGSSDPTVIRCCPPGPVPAP